MDFSKVRSLVANRDPARVDAELVALVRAHSPAAAAAEIRSALAQLSDSEQNALRRALRAGPAASLSPAAWADVARGAAPQIAAARDLSGYYTLQAERDALAAMVRARGGAPEPPAPGPAPSAADAPAAGPAPRKTKERKPTQAEERAQHILGLFAYHGDAPLVARALRLSLAELETELVDLRIRRRAYSLTRGTGRDLPAAVPVKGVPSGPPVRRRQKLAPQPPPSPALSEKDQQAHALKVLLAEAGARRSVLAARLGPPGSPLSDGALVARFRAAGLERELALRERDLIRALWSKHRASEARVAAELQTTPAELRRVAVERGLWRELEGVRDGLRRAARMKRWPAERIEQVLHRRDELRDLGILDELEREVAVRISVLWKGLRGKRDGLELLAKKLHLTGADAEKLQRLLDLR